MMAWNREDGQSVVCKPLRRVAAEGNVNVTRIFSGNFLHFWSKE